MKPVRGLLLGAALLAGSVAGAEPWDAAGMRNPILPGYFADPTVLQHEGTYYLYATIEPWGGETLGCWESSDLTHWTFRELNWPTKVACTSSTSMGAMVWAPSVVRGGDGRFHMFVSVGSEVWKGVADHPLGPWRNALEDRPLISADFDRRYHMIDADAFIDTDGRAYLYWGSGWNWINGACFAAELGPDLASFVGEVRQVTPANYFEGPTMLKHDGRYYLTYSNGKTVSDTYEVRYAVADHPLGPFVEGPTSPILRTAHERRIVSPGHHGFLRTAGQVYILYHRHRIPFEEGTAFRQVCIDPLTFRHDGAIEPVVATHAGPALLRRRQPDAIRLTDADGVRVNASSAAERWTGPERAFDDNYATRWAPAAADRAPMLQIDLGRSRPLQGSSLRFEYPTRRYHVALAVSEDGEAWTTVLDARESGVQGSPVEVAHELDARYLRLAFAAPEAAVPAVWEWVVLE